MGRRDVDEALGRAALGLVPPAVDDGPDRLDAERRGDVAGDRVGVDQQDGLALAGLEGGGEVGRDGRLADAALRVEHGDRSSRGGPATGLDVAAVWSTGPLPSSTVSRRMHIASTRQRIESAE